MKKTLQSNPLKIASLFIVIAIVIGLLGVYPPASQVYAYTGYPTFSITDVVADVSVSIQTYNLPPNQTFTVRMGVYGTRGIGGVVVATTNSGAGGSQKLSYSIPSELKGSYKIAIRMDSPEGYYAFNWFFNSTTDGGVTPTVTPSVPPYTGIPTFSILSVVKDKSVSIKTNNFPADKTFTVRMGAYGTLGIGGIVVGSQDSGSGGSFEATYDIPVELKGSYKIAIRMDNADGYYAYNWFFNNDAPAPGTPTVTPTPGGPTPTPAPIYSGIPTFNISSVVRDVSVTIKAKNFPAGQTFTVRMGAYGTLGIGGLVVGNKDSGAGGDFEATFTIPDSLKGSYKVAIRMDSAAGYYAYNWFYNNTYP
jgi:hypothetical protein